MRKLLRLVGLAATLALVGAGGAAADTATTLPLPKPSWLTPALEAKIVASGTNGVEVPLGKPTNASPFGL